MKTHYCCNYMPLIETHRLDSTLIKHSYPRTVPHVIFEIKSVSNKQAQPPIHIHS